MNSSVVQDLLRDSRWQFEKENLAQPIVLTAEQRQAILYAIECYLALLQSPARRYL